MASPALGRRARSTTASTSEPSSSIRSSVPPGAGVELQLNVRYVVGGRLFWETPLEGLRIGASVLAVHLGRQRVRGPDMPTVPRLNLEATAAHQHGVRGAHPRMR